VLAAAGVLVAAGVLGAGSLGAGEQAASVVAAHGEPSCMVQSLAFLLFRTEYAAFWPMVLVT
jgi:hypothetical protein